MKKSKFSIIFLMLFSSYGMFAQYSNVSTYSGSGIPGFQNGSNATSKYNYPYGVSFDGNKSIYVADLYKNFIGKINMFNK